MPENLRNQKIGFRARVIIGGLLAAGVIGGGLVGREFNSTGLESPTATYVANEEFNAFVTATGSTSNTLRYAATCIANPLVGLTPSSGSASLLRLTVEIGNNPANIGGDVYFTKNCNDKTTTGSTLLVDNFTSATGSVTYYSTPIAWNGAEYIKVVLRGNPTSSFTARIRGEYEDIFGE